LLRATNNHCADLSLRGRYSEMYAAAREGEELARRLGMRENEQNLLGFAGHAAWMLGDWDSCDAFVERHMAGGTYHALYRANAITFLAAPRGLADDCRRAFEEVEPLGVSEDAQVSSGVLQLEGLVLHAEGRFAEAAATLRAAQETEASVHPRFDALTWGMELEALADAGDAVGLEERLAARDALPGVDRTPFVEATHARFRGRLLALRGDSAGAAEALESAARQFAAQSLRFIEAATLVELAEATSSAVPAEACETLERLRAQPWLERADALERAVTV
jgi:tetratricopeptide (TPR) repeat protein